MKNVETKVVALQFQADVPGLPVELIDRVERFAPQPQLGPLYVSYCDDAEEELRDAEPPTQKGPDHIGATKPQTEVVLPKQTQPDPQVVAVRHERQLSQLPLEKVSASAWPATEQPDELIEIVTAQHRTDAGVVRTQADAEITHHTRSEVPGHDVLEGPVEDEIGIEHSLEEVVKWGPSSSADGSSILMERVHDELHVLMGAAVVKFIPGVVAHLEHKLSAGKITELTQCVTVAVTALRNLIAYSIHELGMTREAIEAMDSYKRKGERGFARGVVERRCKLIRRRGRFIAAR